MRSRTFAVCIFSCFHMLCTLADAQERIPPDCAKASSWGFDKEDATECLQAAINSGAKTLIVDNVGAPWIVRPLKGVSDQTIIFEKGVELVAKKGEYRGQTDSMLTYTGASNVCLRGYGATFRMRRDDYADRNAYKFSEWRHTLKIRSCSNVVVEGLRFVDAGGDGVFIGTKWRSPEHSRNIVLRDVTCDRAWRNALSVIAVDGMLIEGCSFLNTHGTLPEAGIDFEPDFAHERIVNVVVRNCISDNNRGKAFGIQAMKSDVTTAPYGIRFENCRASRSKWGWCYTDGTHPRDADKPWDGGTVEFHGCTFEKNELEGVYVVRKPLSSAKHVFKDCKILDNCTESTGSADVSISISEHHAFEPDDYLFENVTVRQGAKRGWIETSVRGDRLANNVTRLRGGVDVVDSEGASRHIALDGPMSLHRDFHDTIWRDPYVYDIKDSDTYLRRKFRQDVTARGTGLRQEKFGKRLAEIVAAGKASGEPWCVTKAKCFAAQVNEQAIDVSPLDWFPAIAIWDRRKLPITKVTKQDRAKEINESMFPAELVGEWQDGNKDGAWHILQDFDHSVPDWRDILKIGCPGMKARLSAIERERGTGNGERGDLFYEGLQIAMDAMLNGIDRFIEQGRKNLQLFTNDNCHNCSQITNENSTRSTCSTRLKNEIACLKRLRSGPPKTAYDVMMFVWLYFFYSEHLDGIQCRSLTELDVFLTPFYNADIASGRTTEAEFREQLKHFLWQWGSINNYWNQPVGLGGTKADGSTAFNHVSKIILDVMDECALTTPKFLVKTSPNTPDWAWDKMLDMARRHRSIAFIGEEPTARALKKWYGADERDCRTMVVKGCYEFSPRDCANDTGIGHVNLLKPIEKMLEEAGNGGIVGEKSSSWRKDGLVGEKKEKIPLSNSKLQLQLSTFDSFKAEYLRRLVAVVDRCREISFELEKALPEVNPANCMTLATEHALKTRMDGFANGCPRGNNSTIAADGIGTTVDALLAVKELVYEKKEMSLAELGAAMAANWKGHEALRRRVLRSARKWGNNDEEANALGAELIDRFAERVNGRSNSRGGIFLASGHCARKYLGFGRQTGATPDGRLAGEEISKNLSPTMGVDTEGATALVATLAASDVTRLPGDYPLDMMLHPSVCHGDRGLKAMRSLVEVFHRNGGSVIQFTVFSAEELKDAQAHPEKYENLQVRVCGWNVRWNDLSRAEQDAYIRRAENVMKGW